jgi:hypothetical protein
VDWFVPIFQPSNMPHFVGVNRASNFTVETNSKNLASRVKIYYVDEETGQRHNLPFDVTDDVSAGQDSQYQVSFRLTDAELRNNAQQHVPKSVTIEVEQQRFDIPLHPEVIQLKRRPRAVLLEDVEREQEIAELRMFMTGGGSEGERGAKGGEDGSKQNAATGQSGATTAVGQTEGVCDQLVFKENEDDLTFEMSCNCDSLSDISFFLVDSETHERFPVAFQHVSGHEGRVRFDFQADFPRTGKTTLVLNARSEIDEAVDCEALRIVLVSSHHDDESEKQRLEEAQLHEERLTQARLVQELLDLEFQEQERLAKLQEEYERDEKDRIAREEMENLRARLRRDAEERERLANEAALRELLEAQSLAAEREVAERLAREEAERKDEERLLEEIELQERETRELEEEIEREMREIEMLEEENEKFDRQERERLQQLKDEELKQQRERIATERAERVKAEDEARAKIANEKEEADRQMRLISKRERNNQLLGLVTSEEQKGQLEMTYTQANPKNKVLIKRFQKEKETKEVYGGGEELFTRIIAPNASFAGQACYFSVDTNQLGEDGSADAATEFSRALRFHVTEIRTGAQCDIHIDEAEEGALCFIPEIYFVPTAPGLYLLEGTYEDMPIEGTGLLFLSFCYLCILVYLLLCFFVFYLCIIFLCFCSFSRARLSVPD